MEQGEGTLKRSREYWNERSKTFGKSSRRNLYVEQFIDKLKLKERQHVFDMGCATGTLAIPLARAGHTVVACDFSPKMLEHLTKKIFQEDLAIQTKLMAWQDDWSEFGFEADSVDVAVASRSISFNDLAGSIDKLEHIAREKVAITVPAGPIPVYDACLMEYLGRTTPANRIDADVIQILADRGRYPELYYFIVERPMRFESWERAKSEFRRMAGQEPFDEREHELFEQYIDKHFNVVEHSGEKRYELDYVLMARWAFISWAKDI